MTKDIFLSLLEHKLKDGGMPKEIVDKSVSHFNEHLSGMSDEECSAYIDKLGGDDAVCAQLLSEFRKNEKQKETVKKTVEAKEVKDIKDLLDDDDVKPKKSAKAEEYFSDGDVKTPSPKPERKAPANASGVKKATDPRKKAGTGAKTAPKAVSKTGKKTDGNNKFTVGLIIASPVLLVLAAIIAAFFASLYAAVALAVIAFAVLLVVLTAFGTAFAVIAIIYGVTQMTAAGGAGLYEMGLGVIAGGITMFLGILMYNFIVRLAPFIYKKLFVFIKFVIEKIKQLYKNVKEACERI